MRNKPTTPKASAKKPITKGKKRSRLYAFVANTVTGFSLATVLLLLIAVASTYISPEHLRLLSIMGLAFPVFLAGTLLMFVISLLVCWRRSWIPLLGLLLCYESINSYFPINLPSPAPKDCLKVMTYNTSGFGLWTGKSKNTEKGDNRLILEVIKEQPDVVGYQEGLGGNQYDKHVRPVLRRNNYHTSSVNLGGSHIGCFSKYPIVDKETLCQTGGNGAVVFKIKLSALDTLYFVVAHLKSMQLSTNDRTLFQDNVSQLRDNDNDDTYDVRGLSHVARKIARASVPRARQADTVAQFIADNSHRNIIVCGDFNDTPVSYTYRTIANAGDLADAFVETGNGIGRTFNRNAMVVRIDHILYSTPHWEPFSGRIINRPDRSDHNAVAVHLKRKKHR